MLVVGHEHKSQAKAVLERLQLVLHRFTQFQVQRAEGFVQQKDAGFIHKGAGQGHALALAAGQLGRFAVAVGVKLDKGQHLVGLGEALGAAHTLDHQAIGDVVAHIHMREQGVVLKDGIHVAQVGRRVRNILAENADPSSGGFFKARDQPEAGCLSRSGRPQHGEE